MNSIGQRHQLHVRLFVVTGIILEVLEEKTNLESLPCKRVFLSYDYPASIFLRWICVPTFFQRENYQFCQVETIAQINIS